MVNEKLSELKKKIVIFEFIRKINIEKLFIRTRTMKRFGSQTFNILIVNEPVCDPRVFNPRPNHCVAYS